MHLLRFRPSRRAMIAFRNRQEIIKAQLSRREMIKLGLLTSAGYLVMSNGLSARADGMPPSPPTTPFRDDFPMIPPPVKRPVSVNGNVSLLTGPAPTISPNTTINPATGLAFEGRTRAHQAFTKYPAKFPFPPQILLEVHQRPGLVQMHPQLPLQPIWGFDGISPGPSYHARYGEPVLVRNFDDLPVNPGDNGGFGLNQVSTHLHNGHTPSESDGFPCDWFRPGQYYDHNYPNVLAGFASTHPPNG